MEGGWTFGFGFGGWWRLVGERERVAVVVVVLVVVLVVVRVMVALVVVLIVVMVVVAVVTLGLGSVVVGGGVKIGGKLIGCPLPWKGGGTEGGAVRGITILLAPTKGSKGVSGVAGEVISTGRALAPRPRLRRTMAFEKRILKRMYMFLIGNCVVERSDRNKIGCTKEKVIPLRVSKNLNFCSNLLMWFAIAVPTKEAVPQLCTLD